LRPAPVEEAAAVAGVLEPLMRLVRISRELVEDLNLQRFVRDSDPRWGDVYYIDRRRWKRELRRLPKLQAAARARFQEQLDNIGYQRRTYGMEYYWKADGSLVSREDLERIKELVDAALVRSISASP
jgi:hypothetical protein